MKKFNFNQLEALKLSLSQLKYYSHNEGELVNSPINLEASEDRGIDSLNRLLRVCANAIQSSEQSDNKQKKEDALWFQNALGAYLSQSGNGSKCNNLDSFLGLGGNKSKKGNKAITELNNKLENGFLMRAFYLSVGDCWEEKNKHLQLKIKEIESDWYLIFSFIKSNFEGLGKINDLFSLIRTCKLTFDAPEDWKLIFDLVLSAETSTRERLKLSPNETFRVYSLDQVRDMDINKIPQLSFKHKKTIDSILMDLELFDDVCAGFENYLSIRKMMKLKVDKQIKKAAFKHESEMRYQNVVNNYLYVK